MKKNLLSLLVLPIVVACGLVAQPLSLETMLEAEHRNSEDKARDVYRNPVATLEFFEVKDSSHVLDVWPGSGWYTDIVAPYVKGKGQYTAAIFAPDQLNSDDKRQVYWSKVSLKFMEKTADKSIYGDINYTVFQDGQFAPETKPNDVDVVLLIRAIHVWDEQGTLHDSLKALWSVMKPGAVLGIVQHRANSLTAISSSAGEGYMDQRYVTEAVKQVGFEFVASSEINKNDKDTKDYPRGVYALPPTLAMGNTDRETYLAIGESDRMTLKFIKPKK